MRSPCPGPDHLDRRDSKPATRPADSPFWTHPQIVLTPHNAADTDPEEISKYVARQIERFEAGGALENIVDPARGSIGATKLRWIASSLCSSQ